MQTPDEFAAQMGSALWNGDDAADLIRARDAEVAEQVRAEFEDMEHRLSVLLCNLTGGLLSKTGYDVATMEQHIEDYFEREVVEPARAETLAGFTEERRSHLPALRGDWVEEVRLIGPWEPTP